MVPGDPAFGNHLVCPVREGAKNRAGSSLNRKQRKHIWPVFEEYQMLMAENNLREPADAMRDARLLMEKEGAGLPYAAIIVDEAQDMGAQAFKLLRAMVPEGSNDMFIVGDAHQRIYDKKVVLGQCGIKIVGRSRRLKVNYRTTEETRQWASGIMAGVTVDDLDGGEDSLSGYVSLVHGTPRRWCTSTHQPMRWQPYANTWNRFERRTIFSGPPVWWPGPIVCWTTMRTP